MYPDGPFVSPEFEFNNMSEVNDFIKTCEQDEKVMNIVLRIRNELYFPYGSHTNI